MMRLLTGLEVTGTSRGMYRTQDRREHTYPENDPVENDLSSIPRLCPISPSAKSCLRSVSCALCRILVVQNLDDLKFLRELAMPSLYDVRTILGAPCGGLRKDARRLSRPRSSSPMWRHRYNVRSKRPVPRILPRSHSCCSD
jgi:hypothetical protein